MTGLYIHIPFCKQKCAYCDFVSFAASDILKEQYIEALLKQMRAQKTVQPDTLYIGGGTPSILSCALIERLLSAVEAQFGTIKDFKESTFEMNPESVDENKVSLLKKYGFKRISIGLQNTCDTHLKTLGRIHNYQTFLNAYSLLQSAGFDNINIDLIAGIPGQSLADFKQDLSNIISLRPTHLSVYGLQVEEGTALYATGFQADQDLMRTMLEYAHHELQKNGLKHYEISNYAAPGFESMHNKNYWENGAYLGLGLGAASFLGGSRIQTTSDLETYLKGENIIDFKETLSGKAALGESVLLALRKLDGTPYTQEIKQNFARSVDTLIKEDLLSFDGQNIKLTLEGVFLANQVFSHFVAPFDE